MISSHMKMALTNNTVISSSVDDNWLCSNCPQHRDRPALRQSGGGERQAIVLADQNFPGNLPVSSNMQWLKIIRIENGSIQDLVNTFISMVGQRKLPGASIVLLLSVCHLSNVGLEGYVADHLAAEQRIWSSFGKETKIGLLPPLLLAGSSSPATIRALHELLAWSEDFYQGADSYLDEAFAAAAAALKNSGEGQQLNIEIRRTRRRQQFFKHGSVHICDRRHAPISCLFDTLFCIYVYNIKNE
jgi:hypothetical protein